MATDTFLSLRNQVIYQIFTRNYGDGTFRAVQADLPRIQALGVDYIYLLPVQPCGVLHRKGSMGSPYAIRDYRAVDPVQGTMEDFIQLTNAIHKAGMKVMLDVVYNHTSPDSWLAENHPEWFYHKPDGQLGNRIGDWWDVVDLDYSHPDLWDYQIDTLKLWAQYVDGFRCDVAPLIPLEFWRRARQEVASVRPGCLWLAESVEPGFIRMTRQSGIPSLSDSELYQAFDLCYDYDTYDLLKAAMTGTGSLRDYLSRVNLQETIYPSNYCKLRCLENHDRQRAAAMAPEDIVLRNWTAWMYFMKGTVMLYAGQEFCAQHHPTLFDRDTVDFHTGKDFSPFFSRLARLKKLSLFADSTFSSHVGGKNEEIIFATHQVNAGAGIPVQTALGIFSTTGRRQSVQVDLPDGCYPDAISGQAVDVFEHVLTFRGEPTILICE